MRRKGGEINRRSEERRRVEERMEEESREEKRWGDGMGWDEWEEERKVGKIRYLKRKEENRTEEKRRIEMKKGWDGMGVLYVTPGLSDSTELNWIELNWMLNIIDT